jgi:hypothetical protein
MWARIRDFWLPRLLFITTLGLAALLSGVVLLAPWLAQENQPGLLSLFAGDAIVRRTTLASALGLVVTAYVFFRPGGILFLRSKNENTRVPPPMAGA